MTTKDIFGLDRQATFLVLLVVILLIMSVLVFPLIYIAIPIAIMAGWREVWMGYE